MNVFIVSDSYVARNLLYCVDYILINNVKEVYLLSENHTILDFQNIKNVKITLVDNIYDALNTCDLLLLAITKNMDYIKIQFIEEVAKSCNRKIVKMNMMISEVSQQFQKLCTKSNKPTIFVIGIGEFTQLCATEFFLNKILCNKIRQFFSWDSYNLLKCINEAIGINPEILRTLNVNIDECELLIYSATFSDVLSIESEYFESLKPDYIILQTDNRLAIDEDIYKLFSAKYGCSIDFIIKSEFATIYSVLDSPFPIFCEKAIADVAPCPTKRIYDDFSRELLNDIYSKLYIPDNIEIIEI